MIEKRIKEIALEAHDVGMESYYNSVGEAISYIGEETSDEDYDKILEQVDILRLKDK